MERDENCLPCLNCRRLAAAAIRNAEDDLRDAYGKKPMGEWQRMEKETAALVEGLRKQDQRCNERIVSKAERESVWVMYHAHCEKCGWDVRSERRFTAFLQPETTNKP